MDLVLDEFDSTSGLVFKGHPTVQDPMLQTVTGCQGNALAFGYDLSAIPENKETWVLVRRSLPVARDLRGFTHVRLAVRGSNVNSHDSVDFKLRDSAARLAVLHLKSITDLPAWRPLYIDLGELDRAVGFDLANITDFEIGIVRCPRPHQPPAQPETCEVPDKPSLPPPPPAAQHSGILYLDELAVVDLSPGKPRRRIQATFESVTPNPAVLAAAANALLAQVVASGPAADLVPTWFPEAMAAPSFNSYAQAEALLVFISEYERTRSLLYRNAAGNLAAKLISLQIAPGRAQSGAWYSTHTIREGALQPPNRVVFPGGACDGNEAMVFEGIPPKLVAKDIDACEWVGNVGWVLVALGRLERSGLYHDAASLRSALDHGSAWVAGQSEYRGMTAEGFPGLIAFGVEGNVSAYFGLVAAGKANAAAVLGNAVFQFGWDPRQRRMRTGVRARDFATAVDVSGSWGASFLRAIGRTAEALDSQGYAASVLRTTSFDGSIAGYGDIAGPYAVAVEFTAQAASAGIAGADFALREILRLPPGPYAGGFSGCSDHWWGGQLEPWCTTMAGVSPTAWVYFALRGDPLFPPSTGLAIDDRAVAEGAAQNASFRITLTAASATSVTVNYATESGTAVAGNDFTATSGTLTFSPGRTSHAVFVPILVDGVAEGSETFTLRLSNAAGAGILDDAGAGTITDQPAASDIPMYRAYNPNVSYHFFTTSQGEFTNAVAAGYRDESNPPCCTIPFKVPNLQGTGKAAIFRMYNPNSGRHYYTASAGERDVLMGVGWVYEKDEGFVYTSQQSGTVEVFKLYNSNSGVHLYTVRPEEKDAILQQFPGIWFQHTSLGFAVP